MTSPQPKIGRTNADPEKEDVPCQPYQNWISPFLEELFYLKISLTVSCLSFFLFSSVDQTLEVYVAYTQNLSGQNINASINIILEVFRSIVLVVFLSFFIWYSGRQLSIKKVKKETEKRGAKKEEGTKKANTEYKPKNSFTADEYYRYFSERESGERASKLGFFAIVSLYFILWVVVYLFSLHLPLFKDQVQTWLNLIPLVSIFFFIIIINSSTSNTYDFIIGICKGISNIRQEFSSLANAFFINPKQEVIKIFQKKIDTLTEEKQIEESKEVSKHRLNSLIWIPRLLSLVPLYSLGLGCIKAGYLIKGKDYSTWTSFDLSTSWICFILWCTIAPLFSIYIINRKKICQSPNQKTNTGSSTTIKKTPPFLKKIEVPERISSILPNRKTLASDEEEGLFNKDLEHSLSTFSFLTLTLFTIPLMPNRNWFGILSLWVLYVSLFCLLFIWNLQEWRKRNHGSKYNQSWSFWVFIIFTIAFIPKLPSSLKGLQADLWIYILWLLSLALLISAILFTTAYNRKLNDRSHNSKAQGTRSKSNIVEFLRSEWLLILEFIAVLFLLLALTFGPQFLLPTALPNLLGPISIVSLFLVCCLFFANSAFYWGYFFKLPVISSFIIIAIIASFFNLNDNHKITPPVPHTQSAAIQPQDIQQGFKTWLNSRQDRNAFTDKPYPVYIVSAQGGGIYAAYHAAATLSRLQDLSPNFAHHVFAISSVSGGSVGAATFAGLVKSEVCKEAPVKNSSEGNCFEKRSDQILGQDLLSTILAAGLFPDFVQRFIPFPINAWDRARGLEYSLESTWDKVIDLKETPNPFTQNFYSHFYYDVQSSYLDEKTSSQDETCTSEESCQKLLKSKSIRSTPNLFINTTVVETGEPLVISPFAVNLPDLKDINTFIQIRDQIDADQTSQRPDQSSQPQDHSTAIDFKLSTASILSARFPLVTPVGWFKDQSEVKYRLADGGYFDNSGMLTALDIGQEISKSIQPKSNQTDDQIKVIYISIIDQQPTPEKIENQGLNELISPVRALFNSRKTLGQSITHQAKFILDSENNQDSDRYRQILLDKKAAKLPLGWYLSEKSQQAISQQIGFSDPKLCPPIKTSEIVVSNPTVEDVCRLNSRQLKQISDDLSL